MSAIIIDGGLVHYESIGRGKPLIFLHGWLGSWRYWIGSMEELSAYFKTYALDLWGFGDSDKFHQRFTIEDYLKLLEDFVENMGIPKLCLVGHSLGAIVAVRYAAKHKDKVEKVVAVSLPITGNAVNFALFQGNRYSRLVPSELQELQREVQKASSKAIELSINSIRELDLRLELINLKVPTLVIYGEKDNIVSSEFSMAFKDFKAPVRFMAIPGTRHFPMLEEPSKFNRLLKEFLALGVELDKLEIKQEWRRKMG